MAAVRIARVRAKATGRTIEIIPRVKRERTLKNLVENAANIAGQYDDAAGYFLVVLGRNGQYNFTWNVAEDFPLGARHSLPFWSK